MNRLASILTPAQVLAQVEVTSKKRAFEEAGLLFENLHGLSRALVTDSLFSRERLGSTGLGHGVAIPSRTHQRAEIAAGGGFSVGKSYRI
jgi:PTS system nitrogen regulatory IIA component